MSKDTETENTTEYTNNTGSLGTILKEFREKANLDIPSVAQALRLPVPAVEALENENFSELPEPPYVRGYLRSYARLADADPQESIDLYETLRGAETNKQTRIPTAIENTHYSPKNPPTELISPFRFKMGLLTLGILGLIIFSMIPAVQEKASSIWSNFSPEEEQVIEATINTTISDNVAGNLPVSEPTAEPEPTESNENVEGNGTEMGAEPSASSEDSSAEDTTSEPSKGETLAGSTVQNDSTTESGGTSNAEEITTEESFSVETAVTGEDPEATNEEKSTPEGDTKLKLVFSDEVWIRINDGEGKRLFEALNPAGTEKELSLSKPLKFKVGNAQGMKLFVDGEETDISEYIKGSVAKFGLE